MNVIGTNDVATAKVMTAIPLAKSEDIYSQKAGTKIGSFGGALTKNVDAGALAKSEDIYSQKAGTKIGSFGGAVMPATLALTKNVDAGALAKSEDIYSQKAGTKIGSFGGTKSWMFGNVGVMPATLATKTAMPSNDFLVSSKTGFLGEIKKLKDASAAEEEAKRLASAEEAAKRIKSTEEDLLKRVAIKEGKEACWYGMTGLLRCGTQAEKDGKAGRVAMSGKAWYYED